MNFHSFHPKGGQKPIIVHITMQFTILSRFYQYVNSNFAKFLNFFAPGFAPRGQTSGANSHKLFLHHGDGRPVQFHTGFFCTTGTDVRCSFKARFFAPGGDRHPVQIHISFFCTTGTDVRYSFKARFFAPGGDRRPVQIYISFFCTRGGQTSGANSHKFFCTTGTDVVQIQGTLFPHQGDGRPRDFF